MAIGEKETVPIGEAVRRAGVPASTLRYWESIGLLAAPRRVGGKRHYDDESLRQLRVIGLSKQLGFTLAEIRILLAGLFGKRNPAGGLAGARIA